MASVKQHVALLKGSSGMEFDDQMRRFFGTDELGAVSPEGMASGIERMLVEFGLETDKGRRFAMWSLLYMLGSAPDLDVAFKDPRDRDAARTFMDLLDQANAEDGG
jgi:hypothetical protein